VVDKRQRFRYGFVHSVDSDFEGCPMGTLVIKPMLSGESILERRGNSGALVMSLANGDCNIIHVHGMCIGSYELSEYDKEYPVVIAI
jgi:hypothetical protein